MTKLVLAIFAFTLLSGLSLAAEDSADSRYQVLVVTTNNSSTGVAVPKSSAWTYIQDTTDGTFRPYRLVPTQTGYIAKPIPGAKSSQTITIEFQPNCRSALGTSC